MIETYIYLSFLIINLKKMKKAWFKRYSNIDGLPLEKYSLLIKNYKESIKARIIFSWKKFNDK